MDKTAGVSGKPAARDAILAAFREIIMESGYETVRVIDVVERSGVARSTFYEHFQSREDLLRDSMRGPFERLAQLAAPAYDPARIAAVLEHLAENRALSKSVMKNPGTDALVDLLTELIENSAGSFVPAITARAVAGAQMAIVSSWLDGKDARSTVDLVRALREISLALLRAETGAR
jgi:AcrR family transcriptional regulator